MKHDYTQKNKFDCQIPPISAEQHMGLELRRPQAREQVRNQPRTPVRGLIVTRSGAVETAFAMRTKDQTVSHLDGGNQVMCSVMCGPG